MLQSTKAPGGASDDGIHGSARVDGCYCGPVVTEDEDCRTSEGREPEVGGDEEVPTFEAGDGEAEALYVIRVVQFIERQTRAKAATSHQESTWMTCPGRDVQVELVFPVEHEETLLGPAEVDFVEETC